MVKLKWSPRALIALQEICDYIARDSEYYAKLFARRIFATVEILRSQPLLGAVVPEYDRADVRQKLFQNYRIVYRVRSDEVEIINIVHAARQFPPERFPKT